MIDSAVVFRSVARGEVLSKLRALLSCSVPEQRTMLYSDLIAALFEHGYDLGKYLLDAVCEDENRYIVMRSKLSEIPESLEFCVKNELQSFSELSRISPDELREWVGEEEFLPRFVSTAFDFPLEYEKRVSNISKTGYGIYARHVMFRVDGEKIVPVHSPDTVSVNDLIGYETERGKVISNTEALVEGFPAANVLLCGDAGTGKSSTVKAVANMFASRGVRLVEVRKDQLWEIPQIMESLRDNPLRFIIFIDDLTFSGKEDDFGALKAILEGSASVRSSNAVIYATSNRRHLVRETFSDRQGDEVHINDTMQEMLSLSERFGLTVTYSKPGKELYLRIVRSLAESKGIIADAQLDIDAEAFALRKGGRSARAAEQFVDSLVSVGNREEYKW